MNSEKQKEIISRELYKKIKAGITVPTGILIAITGAGCTQQSVSEIAGVESESQISQITSVPSTIQESPTTTTTTIQEQEKVKEFEGIKVEIVTDPSFEYLDETINENLDLKMGYEAPPVKEVVFKDPEKGPKILEKALLLTWAYILRSRGNEALWNDFQKIPKEDTEKLIETLIQKYEAGEDLTFTINISEDNRDPAYQEMTKKEYKVDLSKGVKIIFVGKIKEEKSPAGFYNSREFFSLTRAKYKDGTSHIGIGAKLKVSKDGVLTISEYGLNDISEGKTASVGYIFMRLIDQHYNALANIKNESYNRFIWDILFTGNRWENDQWVEYGEPALEVITEQ